MPDFAVRVVVPCCKGHRVTGEDRERAEEKLRRDAAHWAFKLGGDDFTLSCFSKIEQFDPIKEAVEMQWSYTVTRVTNRKPVVTIL